MTPGIIDESHEQPDRDVFDAITRDGDGRDNPAAASTEAMMPSHTEPRTSEAAGAGPATPPRAIFGPEQLKAAVDLELAKIPPGKTTALIGYWTTNGVWRASFVRRVGDHWDFGVTFGQDVAGGKIAGGVMVRGSWP